MKATIELERMNAAHADDVARLAAHGGYRNEIVARRYIEKALAPIWRPVLKLANDGPLVDQLQFSPTVTLLLHLFGRANLHHGSKRARIPVMRHWRPVYDKQAGTLLSPRAIAKNDIAKIIGKRRGAVDAAVGHLRGKREKYRALFDKRIAYPLWVETGIVLDLMLEPNLSFSFMLEDYLHAGRVALDARLNDAEVIQRQQAWCGEGARDKAPVQVVPHAAANEANVQHGAAA
jgi:hypothetical protein